MITAPNHLNNNVLTAVNIITSGPLVGFHDLCEICLIPLDATYEIAKGVMPLFIKFKLDKEETPWLSKADKINYLATGIPPTYASHVLQLWAERLPKQKNKKLALICSDAGFEIPFIKAHFGSDVFDEVFFEIVRDLRSNAAYINDCCSINAEPVAFPKSILSDLSIRYNVLIDHPKDALNLCKAVAKIYKATLKRSFQGIAY